MLWWRDRRRWEIASDNMPKSEFWIIRMNGFMNENMAVCVHHKSFSISGNNGNNITLSHGLHEKSKTYANALVLVGVVYANYLDVLPRYRVWIPFSIMFHSPYEMCDITQLIRPGRKKKQMRKEPRVKHTKPKHCRWYWNDLLTWVETNE